MLFCNVCLRVTGQDKGTKGQKGKRNKFIFLFRYNHSDKSESPKNLFLLPFCPFVSLFHHRQSTLKLVFSDKNS